MSRQSSVLYTVTDDSHSHCYQQVRWSTTRSMWTTDIWRLRKLIITVIATEYKRTIFFMLEHSFPHLVAPCLLDLLVTPDPAGLVLLSDPCNLRTDTTLWMSIRSRWCKNALPSCTVSQISASVITGGYGRSWGYICNLYICPETHLNQLLHDVNIILTVGSVLNLGGATLNTLAVPCRMIIITI